MKSNYIEINKKLWNSKVDVHFDSEFYDVKEFLKGKNSLDEIPLSFLGDVTDLKILHLQCHFGQDSISLSRMGAQITAVDFSEKAIIKGKKLAKQANENVNFICCDVYNLTKYLDEKFDLIYASYGVIGWLPDMEKYAEIITHFLKPKGRFILVEFHPVLWMFDDPIKKIKYSYFKDTPIVESETGTYAEKENSITYEYVCWNHSISEVLSPLLKRENKISKFQEYNYSPYNIFDEGIEISDGKFQVAKWKGMLPLVYAVEVSK